MENNVIKRLRNRYRLVVINDDTYEEIVTFKLSRLSVYVGLSTIFVLLVGLTVALLVFTPLKNYLPGYGSWKSRAEFQQLKMRTDSLEQAVYQRDQYLESLKRTLNGNTTELRDTLSIPIPKPDYSND